MSFNVGLFITYAVSIIVMIGLPIALAFFVTRRFKVSWWVILTGVVTFIVSQVIHYPVLTKIYSLLNDGVLPLPSEKWIPLVIAVLVGFLAALFEEGARYFGFLVVRKKTKSISSAIGLGIGHGGMESIAIAAWPYWPIFAGVLIQFLFIVFYNPGTQIAKGVSSDEVQYVLAQISQVWSSPWHVGILPGLERVIAISTQILLSVLVWKAIRNHSFLWFALAFLYHLLVDGVTVYLQYIGWGTWAIEGILAIFLLANLYLLYYFWKEENAKTEEEVEDAEEDGDEEDEDESDDEDEEDNEDEENDEDDDEDLSSEDDPGVK